MEVVKDGEGGYGGGKRRWVKWQQEDKRGWGEGCGGGERRQVRWQQEDRENGEGSVVEGRGGGWQQVG